MIVSDKVVPFSNVTGKCYIAFGNGLSIPVNKWIQGGPHRFYFTHWYDARTNRYKDVPHDATKIGIINSGIGKIITKINKPTLFKLKLNVHRKVCLAFRRNILSDKICNCFTFIFSFLQL